MDTFSNYKCAKQVFLAAAMIGNYVDRASVIISFLIYFLIWCKIKAALKKAATDENKTRTLEKGKISNFNFFYIWQWQNAKTINM